MSQVQNHKIHTTSLQVQFEGIEEGLGLQDRLALVFHEMVKPALEKEFDLLVDPDTTLVIDSLVLDCGYLTDENWEEKLIQNVLDQVRKEIASNSSSKAKFFTKENKAKEVFFFFMDKGYFPWNSPFSTPKEVEKAIPLDAGFFKKLDQAIQKSSLVTDRLFKSFSPNFISRIFENLGTISNPKIFLIYHYFQKQGKEKIQKALLAGFLHAVSKKQVLSDHEFLKVLIDNTPLENISIIAGFIGSEVIKDKEFKGAFLVIISNPLNPELSRKINQLLKVLMLNYPSSLDKIASPKTNKDPDLFVPESHNNSENQPSKTIKSTEILPKNPSSPVAENTIDPDGDIFIENAGLVLLHPFLNGLFTNLQFVKNGKFEDSSKQQLAAKTLQYLVFGDNELTENYFVLNKLLCRMDLLEVLEFNQEIGANAKKECEELLQSVIGHWAILKNTSVGGLRETFLQRAGKISRVENGWKLKVERKTVDILMDKLPWGIGLIKLPWMSEMIYVDWD